MQFTIERDEANQCWRFTGEVHDAALAKLALDPVEQMALDTPPKAASDWLQDLEILFSRHEQQSATT